MVIPPFIVFVFKGAPRGTVDCNPILLQPAREGELWKDKHIVVLSIVSGYVTNDLFIIIMDEFAFWWTATQPCLDCNMICDNLASYKNKDVIITTRDKGIHLLNIMPGSSHWFQFMIKVVSQFWKITWGTENTNFLALSLLIQGKEKIGSKHYLLKRRPLQLPQTLCKKRSRRWDYSHEIQTSFWKFAKKIISMILRLMVVLSRLSWLK